MATHNEKIITREDKYMFAILADHISEQKSFAFTLAYNVIDHFVEDEKGNVTLKLKQSFIDWAKEQQ